MESAADATHASTNIIHSCSYDFFGRRVATCSSDGMIRVFDEAGRKTAEWRAHYGSIWRVVWAHPEFGQVLASCSFDRKVCIWEETADSDDPTPQPRNGGWRPAAELQNSRDSVHDIEFAPRGLGIWLASCGADGSVRIYEAPDVMDLCTWDMSYEFEADGGRAGDCPCSPQCLAWNPCAAEGMALAIGMSDGGVCLWSLDETGSWTRAMRLEPHSGGPRTPSGHSDCVRDLGWAPDVGRSQHVLAVASRDKSVRLWTLRRALPEGPRSPDESCDEKASVGWSGELSCELPHDSQVWRVSWNTCGSMLAAAVDDGHVHVYIRDVHGKWRRDQSTS